MKTKRLTIPEFLKLLKSEVRKSKVTFEINRDHIRTKDLLCPIEFLAGGRGWEVWNRGRELGLSDNSINHIVDAADCLLDDVRFSNKSSRSILDLRKKILSAVAVQEPVRD